MRFCLYAHKNSLKNGVNEKKDEKRKSGVRQNEHKYIRKEMLTEKTL